MSRFQILNERRFPLTVDGEDKLLPYYRFDHRATLGWGTREFMVFCDNLTNKLYIEEITGGHLVVINDDSLFEAIHRYATQQGFCDMMAPLPKRKK